MLMDEESERRGKRDRRRGYRRLEALGNRHEYSSEIIWHFTCGQCDNWWSQSTTPINYDYQSLHFPVHKVLICPHCGTPNFVQPKPNLPGHKD